MKEADLCLNRFTKKYAESYPPEINYRRLSDNLQAKSSNNFQKSREKLIRQLLAQKNETIGMPHALLSEFVVALAVNPLISPYGYGVDMAAQSIENGKEQRGVDLLVVDDNQKIMMGIDVKLRGNKIDQGRNGGAWLDNIAAPFINLTLGNWKVEAKNKEVNNVKDWLIFCVLPNINDSGQIPELKSLRYFTVPRIKNSLINQLERMESEKTIDFYKLPMNRQKSLACKQKLTGLIGLFTKIESSL